MALINCAECHKPISDRSASCPNCGCPSRAASVRERFELGIAMMKAYRDEIEARLLGSMTLFSGIVGLLLGSPAARDALAHELWLLVLTITIIVLSVGVYIRNVLHWIRRWRIIRDNTDRLQYMDVDYYLRYQDIPRAATLFYVTPVVVISVFILVCMLAISIGYFPVGIAKP